MIGRLDRMARTILLAIALAVAWLVYSFEVTFENWPWTIRDTYRSGSFEGVTIGSTKTAVMEQILLRQRQGALDSVVFIDDAGVVTAQKNAGGPFTPTAVERIGHADHWHMYSPCGAQAGKPICGMDLYFSEDRLLRIVYVSYFGPMDLP